MTQTLNTANLTSPTNPEKQIQVFNDLGNPADTNNDHSDQTKCRFVTHALHKNQTHPPQPPEANTIIERLRNVANDSTTQIPPGQHEMDKETNGKREIRQTKMEVTQLLNDVYSPCREDGVIEHVKNKHTARAHHVDFTSATKHLHECHHQR